MFGRMGRLAVDIDSNAPETRIAKYDELQENNDLLLNERQTTKHKVKSNIIKAQKKQKENYDKKHGAASCFHVGSLVLKKDFTRKKRKGGKLDYRWTGPYTITASKVCFNFKIAILTMLELASYVAGCIIIILLYA